MRYDLCIAEKTYNGIVVGYVIGYWVCTKQAWYEGQKSEYSFRSLCRNMIFDTKEAAIKFREKIESKRVGTGVKFTDAEK